MASNPATPNDLANRSLRALSSQELAVGAQLLTDAWTAILTRLPSVSARLDAVPTDATFRALVTQIQCAMVLRVLNNPDGKLEESGDDYSFRLDSTVSTGTLYLTDTEAGLLSASGGSVNSFTIRPVGRVPDPILSPDTYIF
jgi:hypothetical protein